MKTPIKATNQTAREGCGKAQKPLALIDAAIRILKETQPASSRAVCYRLFLEKLAAFTKPTLKAT